MIDVDDAADFLLRFGAIDDLELTGGGNSADPVAEVFIGHAWFASGSRGKGEYTNARRRIQTQTAALKCLPVTSAESA